MYMWNSSSGHCSNLFITANTLTSPQKHPKHMKRFQGVDMVSDPFIIHSLLGGKGQGKNSLSWSWSQGLMPVL